MTKPTKMAEEDILPAQPAPDTLQTLSTAASINHSCFMQILTTQSFYFDGDLLSISGGAECTRNYK